MWLRSVKQKRVWSCCARAQTVAHAAPQRPASTAASWWSNITGGSANPVGPVDQRVCQLWRQAQQRLQSTLPPAPGLTDASRLPRRPAPQMLLRRAGAQTRQLLRAPAYASAVRISPASALHCQGRPSMSRQVASGAARGSIDKAGVHARIM
eukprot:365467-Chlamydomonas_euryale.AAC.19